MVQLKVGEVDTDIAKELFLKQFAITPTILLSCDELGLCRRTVQRWKKNDPVFKQKFKEVQAVLISVLEDAAYKRAVTGIEKPVYQQGILVGNIIEYSDYLLALLLKANAPHKYGPNAGVGDADEDGEPLNQELNVYHVHASIPLASSEEEVLDLIPIVVPQIEQSNELPGA